MADLQTRLSAFITAVGADIKALYSGTSARRVVSTASSATPTPNMNTTDVYSLTALAVAAAFAAPTGTLTDGRGLIIRIKDNGTARALTWNAVYVPRGVALPTTTVAGKYLHVGLIYNTSTSTWDCIAVAQEA